MQKHELYKIMSKPMARSFRDAEELALADVRRENGILYDAMQEATKQWNKENAGKWETIALRYQTQLELIKKQREALYAMEEAVREEYKAAQDKVYSQQWEALEPVREAQKEERESISTRWKAIEAALIAKYEAKVQARKVS
jgi:outer membrane lipopolysaccharide assembly protein LptE/RlpB